MFPTTQSRFKTALRRSIDAAIDFATLGEYGLASAWEDPAAAGSGAPRARQETPSLAWRAGAPAAGAAAAASAAAAAGTAVLSGAAAVAGATANAGSSATAARAAGPETAAATRVRTPAKLQPATAAARARRDQNAAAIRPASPHCAGQPLRGRALEPTLPHPARRRDGMAPRVQRCLSDAA